MPFVVHCYDLLIKNGTVLDPAAGINKKMDIGIYEPNIADVFEPGTKPGRICARKVIDASGLYIVPGFVEGHGHVLPLSFAYPIDELWKRGITSICDMGSVSISSFNRCRREIMNSAPLTINAALCLSTLMECNRYYDINANIETEVDKYAIKDMFETHPDVLVGIKVFIGHGDTPGEEATRAVIKKAREVCDFVGCRMICHVANPDIPTPEFIGYFNPGDNFTHTYNKGNIINPKTNQVYDEVWEARKRGVLFDSARGGRNWSAEVAKIAFAEGFTPDIISSDLTCLSNDPKTSRLDVHMSECMAMGMSLEDVLYHATNVPASCMKGVDVGVRRGIRANLTIVDPEKGPHTFNDAYGVEYVGDTKIVPKATVVNGKVMYNELKTDY